MSTVRAIGSASRSASDVAAIIAPEGTSRHAPYARAKVAPASSPSRCPTDRLEAGATFGLNRTHMRCSPKDFARYCWQTICERARHALPSTSSGSEPQPHPLPELVEGSQKGLPAVSLHMPCTCDSRNYPSKAICDTMRAALTMSGLFCVSQEQWIDHICVSAPHYRSSQVYVKKPCYFSPWSNKDVPLSDHHYVVATLEVGC